MSKEKIPSARTSIAENFRSITQNSGVTLVEAIIAALIGVIALGGVLEVFNQCNMLVKIEKESAIAQVHIKTIMERISVTPFNDITADFSNGTPDGGEDNDYAALVGGYTLENEQITVNYLDPDSDPLEIVVVGSWLDSRNQPQSLTLSTFRTE